MNIIKKLVILITFLFSSQLALANSNVLVDTNWLEKNINNPKVSIIEVSVVPGVYEKGHIEGAVNFKWHTDLVDTVSRDIISKDRLQDLLQKSGVNQGNTIVLYGDKNNWFAAWAAWVFEIYGIENVKLLDGGRVKWEADKKPLTPLASSIKSGNIKLTKTNDALRARLKDVVDIANKKSNIALVDIRSADEYNGKVFAPAGVPELAVRAGHIPGAVNVSWGQAVNKDGTIKSVEELKKIYAAAGIDGSKPIITYCRIGERSSHTWFVLNKVLGYDARNYDGSWTEYGNSVGNPIQNNTGTVWGKI